MGYLDATFVLTKKNVLLSFRDVTPLVITLASAFLSMLILYFSQISINNGDGAAEGIFEDRTPSANPLSGIPACIPFEYDDCYTIAYVPDANEEVTGWVREVATRNGIGEDGVKGFANDDLLNEFLVANPNRTQAAYIFDDESLEQIGTNNNVQFIVQYNDTDQAEFPLSTTDFHTQVVLPAMIHEMNKVLMPIVAGKDIDINLKTSVFPHPKLLLDTNGEGQDAFGEYGPLLTFGTYFLALVLFLYKIVSEKERGLRDAMKLAGQHQSQHYISWCLPYLVFMLLLTLLLIAFGHAFRFSFFTANDFSVYFLTMLVFSLSLIGWTVLVAAITKQATSVSVVAFNFFIFSYLISTVGLIVYREDEDGVPIVGDNVLFLRELFAILPSTMYVKALQDGSAAAINGFGLTYESAGTYTDVFPIKECWVWTLVSGLVAFLLGMYLDNVLPSKHGAPLKPYYFLLPTYWGIGKKKRTAPIAPEKDSGEGDSDGSTSLPAQSAVQSYDADVEDADVRAEREAVAKGERDSAALLIKNISKSFKAFKAVDDVSFSVKKNTAFALLGHNGAGKSTLFKMLVTSLSPSSGDAYVYGLSVRENQTQVRQLLGVCPQFDIFWDKLTGAEHVEVFAALKGLTKADRAAEIADRLADVHLTEHTNIVAGSYSGGMQRRLSVALSLTGDPKIVLLDECTSGADPLVRRDLWGTIQRAKKGRVVFLITHSIAEAQHLAGHNSIGIMAQGKLRVLGNAMHLKSKFGAGYHLLAVLRREEDATLLADALNQVCPGTSLTTVTAGENGEKLAAYSLPRLAREAEILGAVRTLEDRKDEFQIADYSLNSASLGDVFKSITSLSEDVHENEEETKKRRCCC